MEYRSNHHSFSRRNNHSNSNYNNFNQKYEKSIIQVDSENIGKLIGKAGTNIRDIQDKTKTRIHVSIYEIFILIPIFMKYINLDNIKTHI